MSHKNSMHLVRFFQFATALTLFLSSLSWAQTQLELNTRPLTARGSLSLPQLNDGANGLVTFEIQLADGFFAYEDKFKIESQDFKLAQLKLEPVVEFFDPVSKKTSKGFKGGTQSGKLTAQFEVLPNRDHPSQLTFNLTYQACTETYCLFPTTEKVTIPVVWEAHSRSATTIETQFEQAQQQGLIAVLVFLFIAGFLTSLTPCIFPMIPITISILGVSGQQKSTLQRLLLSLFYVLGIALTYAALGVIAASTGQLFGSLISHPLFNLALVLVFFASALSMMGLIHLPLPQGLQRLLKKTSDKKTYSAAFISGLVAGTVASPCVGPVLIGVLAYVAQTQDIQLGFLYLFVFALGLGQIFIAIGLFSQVLNYLPKAGGWMSAVNQVFGLMLGGVAFYFLSFVIGHSPALFFAGIALTAIAFYWPTFEPGSRNLVRLPGLIAMTLGLTLIAWHTQSSLQSLNGSAVPSESDILNSEFEWQPYSEETLLKASADGKAVMIDFYADWCAACIEFEKLTFPQPEVAEILKSQFVLIKYDATQPSAEFDELRAKYKILGLPAIVFYDRKGQELPLLRAVGFEEAPQFRARLQKVLANF